MRVKCRVLAHSHDRGRVPNMGTVVGLKSLSIMADNPYTCLMFSLVEGVFIHLICLEIFFIPLLLSLVSGSFHAQVHQRF